MKWQPESETGKVALTMAGALAFGIAAICISLWGSGRIWSGLLWAAAWSSIGWFIGFLFGIPRFLSSDTLRQPEPVHRLQQDGAGALGGEPTRSSLTVNTNLEQVSDWLTKIIVGVSLVESQAVLEKMKSAAMFMAASMRGGAESTLLAASDSASSAGAAAAADAAPAASAVAAGVSAAGGLLSEPSLESFSYSMILYFLATGVLGSYLLTRLFLQPALDPANTGPR